MSKPEKENVDSTLGERVKATDKLFKLKTKSLKLVHKILLIRCEMWKLKWHIEELNFHVEALDIKYPSGERAEALDTKDASGGSETVHDSISSSNIK